MRKIKFITKNISWSRYTKMAIMGFFVCAAITSCSKDDNEEEPKGGEMKLSDVVRSQDITELKKNGMDLYEGNNPPNITGIVEFTPWRYDYTNVDYEMSGLGTENSGFSMKFSDQTTGSQSMKVEFLDYYLSEKELKSVFITGSENKFTICFQLHNWGGPSAIWSFDYVYFISGTADGNKLKNVKMATVGLKEKTPNKYNIVVEGGITIHSDADGTSILQPSI